LRACFKQIGISSAAHTTLVSSECINACQTQIKVSEITQCVFVCL
jgi:hypothetical protein